MEAVIQNEMPVMSPFGLNLCGMYVTNERKFSTNPSLTPLNCVFYVTGM